MTQTTNVNSNSNTFFENVTKYLRTAVTNRNYRPVQEEVKIRLNSGSTCCHLVQNLYVSCLALLWQFFLGIVHYRNRKHQNMKVTTNSVVPKVWGAPPGGGGRKRCVEKKLTEFAFRNFQ
jgi:hypothetical protein